VCKGVKKHIPSLHVVQLLLHVGQLLLDAAQLLQDLGQLHVDSDGGHVGDESKFGRCSYEVLAKRNEIRLLGSHCYRRQSCEYI